MPGDGFTDDEEALAKLIFEHTVETIYAKLPTSRMKAIVAMHFELGYQQEMIGRIFGISQARIGEEIGNIQRILMGKPFKAKKQKVKIAVSDFVRISNQIGAQSVSDIMKLCVQLQRQ